MPSRTAIVGGGWLGSALARELAPDVVVTTRSGRWRDGVPPRGMTVVALDVTEPVLDAHALRGCSTLVIAVATGSRRATLEQRRALWIDGVARLLGATTELDWQRVVFIGSTSALPDVDGWVDETQARMPENDRGRVQRQAERVVSEHCEAHATPWWILRMGGLYGPDRELGALYTPRGPTPTLPGDGNTPTNLIHRDDAVAAIIASLQAPASAGGLLHVVDDDHVTRRHMYETIARARGVPPPRWAEPLAPDEPPRGKRVSNHALKSTLGIRLRHPTHHPAQGARP